MTTGRWAALWALAYGVTHHLGLLPALSAGGGLRVTDLVDLLVPYLVVGTALAAVASAGTDRRGWLVAATGAVLYVQGHGVHLAANAVGNARGPAAPVELLDEVLGHALWYGGVAVLAVVVARAAGPELRATPRTLALAAVTGVTWGTNALGAQGLEVAGALVALAVAAVATRLPHAGGRLLLVGALTGAAVTTVGLLVA